jgi:hypothetical protein
MISASRSPTGSAPEARAERAAGRGERAAGPAARNELTVDELELAMYGRRGRQLGGARVEALGGYLTWLEGHPGIGVEDREPRLTLNV